jgi:hypothetical protein
MIHTNTPEHIRKLQSKMMRERTPEERGKMAMEMIDMGRLAVKNRLKQKFPHLSDAELKGEIFRCLYKDRFPADKMAKIIAGIVDWHTRHPGVEW